MKKDEMPDSNLVFFCLARGYRGLHKHHYKKLIIRNLFLNRYLRANRKYESIIFHEGNMSRADQFVIKFFSLNLNLKFVSIIDLWEVPNGHLWTGKSSFGLGYSLMCRFQYLHWWKYLSNYEYAIRVDDDVLVHSLGTPIFGVYKCAKQYPETHKPTNVSFLSFLSNIGMQDFYNHKFPPNCFYISKLDFWHKFKVSTFLESVAANQISIEDRWGDTVVMGVALSAFAQSEDYIVDSSIEYSHLSHAMHLKNGVENFYSTNRFLIYFRAFYNLIKLISCRSY